MGLVCEDVGGPVTAQALNKATNQVAVAGRSVFKIYNIHEDRFELVSNLRIVKNTIVSCNDVAWNQVDNNVLASATPSGAIVTWNLSKASFSKMDLVYQDHKRTVNKICFHPSDPFLLISGSQDSIKVIDLRQSEAVINYSDLNESVRDLQFSPHKANLFIAVQDNGYVQFYDIRKKDKFEQSFPAHNGPILACDWHPELSNTVATAGRDMSIKVWSTTTQIPTMQHCIPAMESVSKINWSYENQDCIASCSLKRDYSVNIWDIHRPFIASARFTELHEITTGLGWRRNSNSLITVTSNGSLYQLPISEAYRPREHTNPVGMAINPDGDIALALGNGLLRSNFNRTSNSDSTMASTSNLSGPNQSSAGTPLQGSLPTKFQHQNLQSHGRLSVTRRSQDSALKSRISNRSQLDVYKCTEMNWFVKTAQEYQLSNRPLAELCDHNAEVCAKLRRFQICQTWKILKLFYANINTGSCATTANAVNNALPNSSSANVNNPSAFEVQSSSKTIAAPPKSPLLPGDDLSISSQVPVSEFSHISANRGSYKPMLKPGSIGALNESEPDDESLDGSENSNESNSVWLNQDTLAYEAFQTKLDIFSRVDKLMGDKREDEASSPSLSDQEDKFAAPYKEETSLKVIKSTLNSDSDLRLTQQFNTKAYQFKFFEIIADVIADVLKYHLDNSDVQSAVSILIVLGDRIKNIVNERIPEVDRESWYYSYIDLLSKFQLWNVMAQVINLSPLPNINSINQTSTTIYTTCGFCNRPINGKVSWICDRCKTKPSECSLCHGVVAGLMAWCHGCYHGGHLIHMSQWFSENDYCPTGCGHMCELSQWR